jgi:hypothetical protein
VHAHDTPDLDAADRAADVTAHLAADVTTHLAADVTTHLAADVTTHLAADHPADDDGLAERLAHRNGIARLSSASPG